MEQRDNTSGGIWSMGKEDSPVPITVAGSFDDFKRNEAHIFVRDVNIFGLQRNI
jgi:hypothetical protein